MSVTIIMGAPGSGKTYSIKSLPVDETIIISCSPMNKGLSYKGGNKNYNIEKKNYFKASSSAEAIVKVTALRKFIEEKGKKKYLVIDDSQFLMFNEYMKRSKETSFQKFVDIQKSFYDLILELSTLPIHCFLLHHIEDIITDGVKESRMKLLGKMLEEKVSIEGMFDEVLLAKCFRENDKTEFVFMTQSDGTSRAKSREGMFSDLYIPNDLKLVADAIEAYDN